MTGQHLLLTNLHACIDHAQQDVHREEAQDTPVGC
jgi:hypothetical protein